MRLLLIAIPLSLGIAATAYPASSATLERRDDSCTVQCVEKDGKCKATESFGNVGGACKGCACRSRTKLNIHKKETKKRQKEKKEKKQKDYKEMKDRMNINKLDFGLVGLVKIRTKLDLKHASLDANPDKFLLKKKI
ncbi:hypothetical protein C8J56DRAFT_886235 [Mycena floridula]|nr:hypothetical protein C8J56DRAFT_886235 [Mycena floridula]